MNIPPDPSYGAGAYGYGAPPTAHQRLQWAIARRDQTDYQIDFWSVLGWTILTCSVFGFFIFYKLVWRSVEHNKRRLEVLDAAAALAWEQAIAQGREEELTPRFQALGYHLGPLRQLTTEFRDPGLWLVISLVSSGIGTYIAYCLIDGDLAKHDAGEMAAEHELAAIYTALGAPLPPPEPRPPKTAHNYVGRVIALLATCGIYGLWWLYDLAVEGNAHQRANWASEDALWIAAGQLASAA